MMSASLIIGRPVALHLEIVVVVAMEEMAVVVAVAAAVVVALVAVVTVAVAVVAVIMNKDILFHQPITRWCVSSMARPKLRARTVDGTVATVTICQEATSYPA